MKEFDDACVSAIKTKVFKWGSWRISDSAVKKKDKISKGTATAGFLLVHSPKPKNIEAGELDCTPNSPKNKGSFFNILEISFDIVLRAGFEPAQT